MADPDVRRRFLEERREICRHRMDTIHAPVYDERWGSYLNPTHERCLRALVERLLPGARVLDAACGTGKYWPILLGAGLDVVGTDHSQAMLDVAHGKHPRVPTRRLALQDLGASDLGELDAVLCIDALENVGPEDWPVVAAGLRRVLKGEGVGYVTVELPDDSDVPDAIDAPLEVGEVVSGGAYHYYPSVDEATAVLREAGFAVEEVLEGDGYAHATLIAR